MFGTVLQYLLYLIILVVLAIPLGAYIKKVMYGEKTFLSKMLTPCENLVYRIMRVNKDEEMSWKKYLCSVLIFSGIGFVFLFLLQLLQGIFPGNPQGIDGISWHMAFNTAASFVTNTNWQSYSGESAMSYLTQALGLTVQNFVSAATGIAVLFAMIRAFTRVKEKGLGSFWVDMTRIVIHILIPLNLVIALCLVGGGVIQNWKGAEAVTLLEPVAVSAEGEVLENAVIDVEKNTVTVNGKVLTDADIITEEFVPMGPAASQVAIKQTGTNGGGFMGVNSAHPLENPNAFTNIIEMISILLIPVALCFTFGKAVKNKKQGIAIFMAMFICLVIALSCIAVNEQIGTTQLGQDGAVNMTMVQQSGGNMEGKEARFGIVGSSTWAAFTTAASSGSVNSMHDSYMDRFRRELIQEVTVPVGTLPLYQTLTNAAKKRGSAFKMEAEDLFETIEAQAADGVDFMAFHPGITLEMLSKIKASKRIDPMVSFGGSHLIGWMVKNNKENPLFEQYDRLLAICKKYDVTLALADAMRPGCLADSLDAPMVEELVLLGDMVARTQAEGVQIMVKGPGHMPLNHVEATMRLQKSLCHNAPYFVFGPLLTDVAVGYDHINAAIGGALSAYHGADFLCYVTAAEHLGLPNKKQVKEGVIAARIGAHAGDIGKGIPCAAEWDLAISVARKDLDWEKQIELAIDPEEAKYIRETRNPSGSKGCAMCGKYCAMKILSKYLDLDHVYQC